MTEIDPHENPDSVAPEVAAVVERAAPEYTDLSLKRRFRFMNVLGIAALLVMAWVAVQSLTGGDELDSLRSRNETLTNTIESQQLLIDKLATQLDEALAQGATVDTPEVVAAETPGADVSPVEGPAGERGDAGPPGEPGSSGDVGSPGSTGPRGLPGADGSPGVAGADGSPGATGAEGGAGSNGVNGTPGANGADGTPGQPGANGAPGAQGPPGPIPQTMTCTPTDPLDLSQPWSCVVTS